MTHPYSIYVWQPGRRATDKGIWTEPVQAYTQEYALYVANLIHKDSKAVIKVVRFGITLACFPDEKTVERIEQFIARQRTDK